MKKNRILTIAAILLMLVFPVVLEVYDAAITGDEVVTYSMANNSNGGFVFSEGRVAAYFKEYIVSDSVSSFFANLRREAEDVLQNRRSARFFQYKTDSEVHYYTQDEMQDWFEKREYERFNLQDTWLFSQSDDANSYLYYCLLNVCSSLFPSISATKWSGFLLNFVLYGILLALFYRLARHLDAKTVPAVVFTLLAAMSYEVLNKVVYIRTYVLAMCFVILLADCHVQFWKQCFERKESEKIRIWFFVPIIVLAYISHYTTAFFTASLAIATVIFLIRNGQHKRALHYALVIILSGILALAADPVSVPGMLSKLTGGSGGGASAFLSELNQYFLISLIPGIPMALWLIGTIIASYLCSQQRRQFTPAYKTLLTAAVIFLVIILAGTKGPRYLSVATPIFLILLEIYVWDRFSVFKPEKGGNVIAVITIVLYLVSSCIYTVRTMNAANTDSTNTEAVLSEVRDNTCIFLRSRRSGYQNAWYLPQFSASQVITLSTDNWETLVDEKVFENDRLIVMVDPSAAEDVPEDWFAAHSFKQTECLLKNEAIELYEYRRS